MKKIILSLAICGIAFAPAEAKKKKDTKNESQMTLNTAVDSMSYALGVSVGSEFITNLENIPGGEYNRGLFLAGFETALKNEPTLMTKEFAQEFFQTYMMEAYERESMLKKEEGEKFLAENRTKQGVYETPSGLQYVILQDGDGPRATSEEDIVRVHYEGFLLDGTKFDSSIDRGEPIDFPLNRVIIGWTEGMQLMPVGSKYKFFIPYDLAYGERGAGNMIPPYSALIFEVELLDINPEN